MWGSTGLPQNWDSEIYICGGGGSGQPTDLIKPEGFAALLRINGKRVGETNLYLTEGGGLHD